MKIGVNVNYQNIFTVCEVFVPDFNLMFQRWRIVVAIGVSKVRLLR